MTDFINHYETLEVSASASFETVERVFRYLAQRYHPDSTEHGDIQKFAQIAEAYEVLGDLEKRAKFDIELAQQKVAEVELVEGAGTIGDDTADRHRLLSLFYAQRRKDIKNPGLGINTVEQLMGIPVEVLDFHVWFFREKGWIQREEGGAISITADGVEKLEASAERQAEQSRLRITDTNHLPAPAVAPAPAPAPAVVGIVPASPAAGV